MYAEDFLIERTETLLDIGVPKDLAIFMTREAGLENKFELRPIDNMKDMKKAIRFDNDNAIMKHRNGSWSLVRTEPADEEHYREYGKTYGARLAPIMTVYTVSPSEEIEKQSYTFKTQQFSTVFKTAEKIWVFNRGDYDAHEIERLKKPKNYRQSGTSPEFSAEDYLKELIPYYKKQYRKYLKKVIRFLEKALRNKDFTMLSKYNVYASKIDLLLKQNNKVLDNVAGGFHVPHSHLRRLVDWIDEKFNDNKGFQPDASPEEIVNYKNILRTGVIEYFKTIVNPKLKKDLKQIQQQAAVDKFRHYDV